MEAAVAPPRFSFDRGVPETAPLGARSMAFFVDLVLLLIFNLATGAALVGGGLVPAPDLDGTLEEIAADPFVVVITLIEAPLNLAYFVACETVWGRTVGKLALGLRVVAADSAARPRVGQATLRNLFRFLWVVPFLSVAFLVIDWYLMHSGEMDQRIGDLVAKTYVVRDGAWWPPSGDGLDGPEGGVPPGR